jgi:hypothetical protein
VFRESFATIGKWLRQLATSGLLPRGTFMTARRSAPALHGQHVGHRCQAVRWKVRPSGEAAFEPEWRVPCLRSAHPKPSK